MTTDGRHLALIPYFMAAFVVQDLEGVTLTPLAEEMNRELSAISQAAIRIH